MADIIFMLLFRYCLPRYFVCIFNNFNTYSCIIACFTLSALFNIGADLNTTSIIILECFHLVSLFSSLNKLIQENKFLEQYGSWSPISSVSSVSSGCSPITQAGKSITEMLKIKKINIIYWSLNKQIIQNKNTTLIISMFSTECKD